MTGVALDRRKLLTAAGGLAFVGGVSLQTRAWGADRFSGYPFALGVASGDPWPDGFVLWTRLAPQPLEPHGGMPLAVVPVRWEVAEDERFGRIVQAGETYARPELAHSVHVEVEGLQPFRHYWYRFRVEGAEASPIGRVRTAPARGQTPDRMRMAVAGCQALYHGWFDAYRHMSRDADLDVVFHYGDYIYEGGTAHGAGRYEIRDASGAVFDGRTHVGGEIYSLDDYRRRYAQYQSDPDLQAAQAAFAFISSFDDHEVDNDWASAYDQDGTPPEVFALRRQAAMQAWYEHMPVRRSQFPRLGEVTMYRRLDYGGLMRMHVLDTRSYRDDQLCVRPGQKNCRTGEEAEATILGQSQEAWLNQGLRNDAVWNLIAQQVFIMPLKGVNARGQALPAFNDKWDGYPASRRRLVQTISDLKLTNVVFSGGDAHMHAVGSVPLRDDEPDGPSVGAEFLCSSITSNGDGALRSPNVARFLDADNPHLVLCNDLRGYQTYDITAREWRTDVMVMDQVQKPGGQISTIASFALSPDSPALHRS